MNFASFFHLVICHPVNGCHILVATLAQKAADPASISVAALDTVLAVVAFQILVRALSSSTCCGAGARYAELISCDAAAKEDYMPGLHAPTNNIALGAPVVGPF